ncbi:MAG: hypothetical protein ACKOBW_06860 [Planctomycetota bacterium]
MAGKKKKRSQPQAVSKSAASGGEGERDTRISEALTVAWMLALMATLAAEVLGAIGWCILLARDDGSRAPALIGLIPVVLFFVSLVTGVACLILGFVVRRVRPDPPPSAIFRTGVVAGILPWLLLLSLFVLRVG